MLLYQTLAQINNKFVNKYLTTWQFPPKPSIGLSIASWGVIISARSLFS
jgi:hypothetical protein